MESRSDSIKCHPALDSGARPGLTSHTEASLKARADKTHPHMSHHFRRNHAVVSRVEWTWSILGPLALADGGRPPSAGTRSVRSEAHFQAVGSYGEGFHLK
jgi:hypothetical protein